MSPEQCRAARGWLGWSQLDLARKAGVSGSTVRDFEAGRRVPMPNNLRAISRVLEEAGIEFIYSGETPIAVGIARREAEKTAPVTKERVRPARPKKRRR